MSIKDIEYLKTCFDGSQRLEKIDFQNATVQDNDGKYCGDDHFPGLIDQLIHPDHNDPEKRVCTSLSFQLPEHDKVMPKTVTALSRFIASQVPGSNFKIPFSNLRIEGVPWMEEE